MEALSKKAVNRSLRTELFQMDVLGADWGKVGLTLLIFGESTLLLRLSAELQLFLPPHLQREQGEYRVKIILLAQLLQAQPDHTTEDGAVIRADSKSVPVSLAGAASMGWGRRNRPLSVLESASAATDLDLISYLRSIPDARMRRGVRFPAWYLLLVAVRRRLGRRDAAGQTGAWAHPGGLGRHQLDRGGDGERQPRQQALSGAAPVPHQPAHHTTSAAATGARPLEHWRLALDPRHPASWGRPPLSR